MRTLCLDWDCDTTHTITLMLSQNILINFMQTSLRAEHYWHVQVLPYFCDCKRGNRAILTQRTWNILNSYFHQCWLTLLNMSLPFRDHHSTRRTKSTSFTMRRLRYVGLLCGELLVLFDCSADVLAVISLKQKLLAGGVQTESDLEELDDEVMTCVFIFIDSQKNVKLKNKSKRIGMS